jgi:hypothetical protein
LAGTVTNSLTDAGLSGLSIVIDPQPQGVEITTDTDGGFLQELPAGVYDLTFAHGSFTEQVKTVSILAGETTMADAALEPLEPVIVIASTTGDAAPGGAVDATVSIEILDGSTVQSIAWVQSNSVTATISGETTETATVTLPAVDVFKDELVLHLTEPPVTQEQLPPNVHLPEGEFPGGLPDRFQVVGVNPLALEEAGHVALTVNVTTSSGTYTDHTDIHTELPWNVAGGILNVPIGRPVLLHGKTQDTYDWSLTTTPSGSSTSLVDGTTQNPYFTPDVAGFYTVSVTDNATDPAAPATVAIDIHAGTFAGAITGQDADGRPLAAGCTGCHTDGGVARDFFTPWAQTGHAEIFTNNLNTSTHYSDNCFPCHTVGFDLGVDNNGIDDEAQYQAFLDAGLLNNPGENWTRMLDDTADPDLSGVARMANIQCENCHGPNNPFSGGAHMGSAEGAPSPQRVSLSSDVCATCHGEPLRHARFQQWQLSAHANYELAIDEGESGNCSRCHTVNGFLAWLPILLDDDPATDPTASITVDWAPEDVHPQTCVTCHDPHDIGTTTGSDTNAIIRVSGDTPPLIGGFQVFGAGRGAICMTCHNSRRGLRNDSNFADFVGTSEAARAPHGSSQTDVLMGENAFLVEVGVRGSHSLITDTCANCHMVQTPPPDVLSYNQGGTNHTFFASATICSNCHGEIEAEGLQTAFDANASVLKEMIEDALLTLIEDQITAGNTIMVPGDTADVEIADAATIESIDFGEARGRQAMTITLTDGTVLGPSRMNDITVWDATPAEIGDLYDFADERLIKAGWNYNLANNDGSRGVHNPPFVFGFIDASVDALEELAGP